MTSNDNEFKIKVFKMGESEVPAPEVYWMQGWNEWETLSFHALLAYNEKRNFLINTGFPLDLSERNKSMIEFAGERSIFKPYRKIKDHLSDLGLKPIDIQNVSFTPIQDYTVGRLDLFTKSSIYISRKGWIEDIVAPQYPKHLSRRLFIPDQILMYLLFDAWNRISFINTTEKTELIPGIEVVWVGCHHRASLAFIINTRKGPYVFTDCAFKANNIQHKIPIGIAENTLECLDAYDKLLKIGKVLPAYDPSIDDLSVE